MEHGKRATLVQSEYGNGRQQPAGDTEAKDLLLKKKGEIVMQGEKEKEKHSQSAGQTVVDRRVSASNLSLYAQPSNGTTADMCI